MRQEPVRSSDVPTARQVGTEQVPCEFCEVPFDISQFITHQVITYPSLVDKFARRTIVIDTMPSNT